MCLEMPCLGKILKFHLISWYGNFVESYRQFARNSTKTVTLHKITTNFLVKFLIKLEKVLTLF